jgi:CelD/BcsL family acetyltransferase involved in cellulose biosynthesis
LQKDLPVFASWRRENFEVGGREVAVRLVPVAQVRDAFIANWLDLEARAEEGNLFLSPHFILPALRLLTRQRVLLLKIFRRDGPQEQLIGLGTFVARPPTAQFPLPHLEAYCSPHTFLTGMLLDRDHHWLALEALSAYLSSAMVQWCGIEFRDCLADGIHGNFHGEQTGTLPVRWSEYYRRRRAILPRAEAAARHAELLASSGLGKDIRRKLRRLGKLGRVDTRVLVGREVTAEAIETFLQLENQGWKRDNQTSLLSQASHAEFFRDMATRLAAEGRAFFCELLLDGRVIASSSNFVSGRIGFAFKIGWDREFADAGPGLLSELELMRWFGEGRLDIDYIDSGAAEGSYIERLWGTATDLASGVLVGGNVGTAVLPALSLARDLKRVVVGR